MKKTSFAACATVSLMAMAAAAPAFAENVLVSPIGNNPPHLNPMLTTDVAASAVSYPVFDTLVVQDANYVAQPRIATSWEANDDATEFTFQIREGVVFHNGEPLTAEDVAFSLETYLPIAPTTSMLKDYIESITAPDAQTVKVVLNQPFAPFVEMMAGVRILPKSVYGDGQDIATHPANMEPVGSGPFRFVAFESGERVILERNDDFWGETPAVDVIVMPLIPDQNARILALEGGDLDFVEASYLDKSSYDRLLASPNLESFTVLGGVNTLTAAVNGREGPLADFAVRKAVYEAINRDMLAERAYYGYGDVGRGAIPAAISWAADESIDFNELMPFDPAAAAEALDAAGYPVGADGTRFTIDLTYPSEYGLLASAGGVIKSNLEDIGIAVNLEGAEFNVWADRTYTSHDFDMSIVFYTSYQDPSVGVARVYVCNPDDVAFRNPAGICDEELDAAFVRAGAVADPEARKAAFGEAEERLMQIMHAYPLIEESARHFGRSDRWDFSEAMATMPADWSLVKPK